MTDTHPALEVIIVDDQLAVRRGIELVLRDGGFRVAGVAGSAEQARTLLYRRRFDAALVELMVGGEPAVAFAAELLAQRPDTPLVVCAGRDAPARAVAAAAALPPPGFVLKSSPPATMWEALRRVAAGDTFLDPGLAGRLPEVSARSRRSSVALLSPREREILSMLADGASGAEIAQRLFLSAETVRTHVRNAASKLGARTRTQAVAMLVAEEG